MSLVGALNIAVSSVNSINSAIRVVSENVSNAENDAYNAREAEFANRATGGVVISDISRRVNDGLFLDLSNAISATSASEVHADYYSRIEDLLGTTGTGTPLVDKVEELNSAWKAFEAAPESDAAEKAVILAAQNITREMERISDALDQVEQSLEDEITDTVDSLNTILSEVNDLTDTIVREKAKGNPISHLENLRDAQLLELSKLIEIDTIADDTGFLAVYTTTGLDLALVNASTFTWDAGAYTLTKSGSTSTNLITDNKLSDGKLKALLDLGRTDNAAISSADGTFNPIQKLRNSLDEFAFTMIDDSVARHTGSQYLTGITDLTTDTTVSITAGQTVTVNAGGQAAATTVTITAGMSIDTLVTNLNAITNVEARLDAHGQLMIMTSAEGMTIGGTAAQALGLTTGTDVTVAADTDPSVNYAYAEEFGLSTTNIAGNTDLTLLAGVAAGDSFDVSVNGTTSTITIGASPYSTSDLLAALNAVEGVRAYTTDDGFLRISSVEGNFAISENNNTPLAGLGFQLNGSDVSLSGTAGSGELTTRFFEVISGNNVENPSRVNIRVNDVLVDGTSSLKDGSGTAVVNALSASGRNHSGSGLDLTNETYTGYVAGITININTFSARFETLKENDAAISDSLNVRLRNETGVDIDEEMAMMTLLQNSYAATARVISTVNQMFQTLEQAVR